MKRKKIIPFLFAHKRDVIILSLAFIPAIAALIYFGSKLVAHASFGTWGDTSLVHACEDARGRITIVAAGATCNTNETQVTMLKDVDAGTGLSITRSSSGATLSLANTNTDGWNAANETWTYASSDAPSYTFTVSGDDTGKYSPGMRVKLTQTSTEYFIITAVSYSSPNTTVTLYGGTDYTLANASITNPYYSSAKAPVGFPLNPNKWTVQYSTTNSATQASPTVNTWYNLGSESLTIPIGAWNVEYEVTAQTWNSTPVYLSMFVTLSTSNNSESDSAMTTREYNQTGSSTNIIHNQTRNESISLTSKTTYYLNAKTDQSNGASLQFSGQYGDTIIRAVSAYL